MPEGQGKFSLPLSDDIIGRILGTVIWQEDVDTASISQRINTVAYFFTELKDAPKERPSESLRDWLQLIKKLDRLRKNLIELPAQELIALEMAIERLADTKNELPDFRKIETYVCPSDDTNGERRVSFWPAYEQFLHWIGCLQWLSDALTEAAEEVRREIEADAVIDPATGKAQPRPGGNRPNHVLHTFIRGLDGIYWENARNPVKPIPSGDGAKGELVDFLMACLDAVGDGETSNTAIYRNWQRATATITL